MQQETFKLEFVVDDKGDPSVGIFAALTEISIHLSSTQPDSYLVDEDGIGYWKQAIADIFDVPDNCVKTKSEFTLEQAEFAKFESSEQ